MAETIVRTVCPHDCPDQCSILATVTDGRLTAVVGDPEHPFTRGFLCGKVNRYVDRVYSPERLLTPLQRTGPKGSGQFAPISWDEALTRIAERWRQVIDTYGSEALVGYVYSGHMGLVSRTLYRALFNALGASQIETGTVCDTTCVAAWEAAVGDASSADMETIPQSDLILCWGANLATTNVHLLPLVEEARAKGAQLVVIDPYRTRTARRADWHLAPRLGTDAALALGLMHVLEREGLHDQAYLAAHGVGWDRLVAEVLPQYAPERVAEITGLPVADIERLARLYAAARAPFLRIGMGMSRHAGGGTAFRTVALLPAVVGAWGREGAGAAFEAPSAFRFNGGALSRPDLLPRSTRELNMVELGRNLQQLSDPPIMALFVAAHNPAVTVPDSNAVRQGLSREDLFTVVHDTFLSDTARYADIVLPAPSSLETADLMRSYGAPYAQYAPQVLEPLGESRSNAWVAQALAARMGLSDPVFTRTIDELLEALLEGSGLSLAGLKTGGPVRGTPPAPAPVTTYFVNEALGEAALPGWTPDPALADEGARYPLRLLTAPGHSLHHTTFGAVEALRRMEGEPRCLIHPDDAAAYGVSDGQAVELYNDPGVRGPAGPRHHRHPAGPGGGGGAPQPGPLPFRRPAERPDLQPPGGPGRGSHVPVDLGGHPQRDSWRGLDGSRNPGHNG